MNWVRYDNHLAMFLEGRPREHAISALGYTEVFYFEEDKGVAHFMATKDGKSWAHGLHDKTAGRGGSLAIWPDEPVQAPNSLKAVLALRIARRREEIEASERAIASMREEYERLVKEFEA